MTSESKAALLAFLQSFPVKIIFVPIAVIVGIGSVVWELQMTRQVSIDTYALITTSDETSGNSAMYGERAAEVIATVWLRTIPDR